MTMPTERPGLPPQVVRFFAALPWLQLPRALAAHAGEKAEVV